MKQNNKDFLIGLVIAPASLLVTLLYKLSLILQKLKIKEKVEDIVFNKIGLGFTLYVGFAIITLALIILGLIWSVY